MKQEKSSTERRKSMNNDKNLPEAIKKYESGYYECPHSCGAVYHKLSFTHAAFICKDCGGTFKVPSEVKILPVKKYRKKKEPSNGK